MVSTSIDGYKFWHDWLLSLAGGRPDYLLPLPGVQHFLHTSAVSCFPGCTIYIAQL